MTDQSLLDIESLVQPISEEAPTGAELGAASSTFGELKWEFGQARDRERKLREWAFAPEGESPEAPNWKRVIEQAQALLLRESKDLRAAAWLTEGLLRVHGFGGLRDGLYLIHQLCIRYWPSIHPQPTEDGHTDTVAQFAGLVGEASDAALIEIPITNSRQGDRFTIIDYTQAAELDSVDDPAVREKMVKEGAISLDRFQQAISLTDSAYFVDLHRTLSEIESLLTETSEFLDANCAPNEFGEPTAPAVNPMRSRIAAIRQVIESQARQHLQTVVPGDLEDGTAADQAAVDSQGQPAAGAAAGAITSRDQALDLLRRVADYFERTEPHSPISYALRKVINWGKKPLPELLAELVEDSNVMAELAKQLGFDRSES